jgi:CheY-like chemotaxis protein
MPPTATPLVLLIEDDRDTREMYVLGLQAFGIELAEASTGTEGLELAVKLRPQAIVTDLTLPDMDGLELCQQLLADARTRDVPLIALTGRSTESMSLPAGVKRVLIKPCLPDDLAATLREVLSE